MKLFRWLFLTKEIKSKTGELHFRRYRIFWTPWFALYIHRIYKADSDEHMHSHPWTFFGHIISGGYVEQTNLTGQEYNVRTAGSTFLRQWMEYHKIVHLISPTTSIVFTHFNQHEWGYQVNGQHCDHVLYRKLKHAGLLADFSPCTDYSELLKEDEVKVVDVQNL